jgi:hypothetical protein
VPTYLWNDRIIPQAKPYQLMALDQVREWLHQLW